MKIFSFILAALFFTSAALQLNDPDPLLWVTLYGVTAIIAVFAAFRKYNAWIILVVIAACAYELFQMFPGIGPCISSGMPPITGAMKAETPCIEMVREFLGILITLAALIFFYVRARRQQLLAIEEPATKF